MSEIDMPIWVYIFYQGLHIFSSSDKIPRFCTLRNAPSIEPRLMKIYLKEILERIFVLVFVTCVLASIPNKKSDRALPDHNYVIFIPIRIGFIQDMMWIKSWGFNFKPFEVARVRTHWPYESCYWYNMLSRIVILESDSRKKKLKTGDIDRFANIENIENFYKGIKGNWTEKTSN